MFMTKNILIGIAFVLLPLGASAQKILTGPKMKINKENPVQKPTTPTRGTTTKKTGGGSKGTTRRVSTVDYTRFNDGLVRAAENGDVKACHCLGHLYDEEYGYNGVLHDNDAATKWYAVAADGGDYCAQIDLVFHCLDWPQTTKALDYVSKYASMGNVCMQNTLGRYYLKKNDLKQAFHWFQTAANNKNAYDDAYNDNGIGPLVESWYQLGKCYSEGKGVERDDAEGRRWLQKAADSGSMSAKKYLNQLSK